MGIKFDENGHLPPGIHQMTWPEFSSAFAWSARRKLLTNGLKKALLELEKAGCGRVFIDGSYVTDKEEPDDFDGCWDPAGVDYSLLDPVLLTFDPGRLAQKTKYGGELFLASAVADRGTQELYMEFFQKDRDGVPKGIVQIDLGGLK